jgi:hypothetical protein
LVAYQRCGWLFATFSSRELQVIVRDPAADMLGVTVLLIYNYQYQSLPMISGFIGVWKVHKKDKQMCFQNMWITNLFSHLLVDFKTMQEVWQLWWQ